MSRGGIFMNRTPWFSTMRQSFSLFPLSRLRFSSLCCCSALERRAAKRMAYNNAFESGRADEQRAFVLRSCRRAAQRER